MMQYIWIPVVIGVILYVDSCIRDVKDSIVRNNTLRNEQISELQERIERIEARLGHTE